jgi:hypothetical protein
MRMSPSILHLFLMILVIVSFRRDHLNHPQFATHIKILSVSSAAAAPCVQSNVCM